MSPIRFLVRYFLSGLVAILPLVVTVGLVAWGMNYLFAWFGPETFFGRGLAVVGLHFAPNSTLAYFVGWLVILASIVGLGFFVEAITRKMAVNWFDAGVKKIPLVGSIYSTTRQFTNLMNNDGGDMKTMKPVYCRFGSTPGGLLILALMPSDEECLIDGHPYKVVIVPTAPVPFGGGMFFIPAADIFPAEMSIEAFMQFYVSMGVAKK